MRFFPPTEGRGRSWIARMRGLGREEEDLEDTVSHLSIYLTGLDELYREQAEQLKHQIRRAEKTIQEMKEQQTRAARAEYSLAALQVQMQECEAELQEQRTRTARAENSLAALQARMQEYEARGGICGWIEEEEEPEEIYWDKGTQTEDDVMDQCLPPKKHPIQIEEESP